MRWLIFLLLVAALLWYIRGVEEKKPPPIEESFIGEPVKALHKAQGFEKKTLDADATRKKKIEEQLDKDSGG